MKFDSPLAVALLIVGFVFTALGFIESSFRSTSSSGALGSFYVAGGIGAIAAGFLLLSARTRR